MTTEASNPPVSKTMFEKIWDGHTVREAPGESTILYIDRHLVHEMTSPQAFAGLRLARREVHRPDATVAVLDHSVPTVQGRRMLDVVDSESLECLTTMEQNAREFGLTLYDMADARQGIVHIIGPEQGLTLPGMTIVCGDSHTSTHGAVGALAWGIGTSEIEHVLATQTIAQTKPGTMAVIVDGVLPADCAAKDVILAIIARIGTAGGAGNVIEYQGAAIRALSMEGRLTICNMSIEAGARAGMVAPDDVTFAWLEGRPFAPKGAQWEQALDEWRSLATDTGATFDREVTIDAAALRPYVTWGTNPAQSVSIDGAVPDPDALPQDARESARRALRYQDLTPGTAMRDIAVDAVFIGSCSNARI